MIDAETDTRNILHTLEPYSIIALCSTVTKGLKRSDNPEEAIEIIIKHSKDLISILRRQAVTKVIIFNYLTANNVKIPSPITKDELVDLVVARWISSASSSTTVETPNVGLMAQEFARWFYQMLNSNECGAEHFFPDANLTLNMFTDSSCNSTSTTTTEGDAEAIVSALLKVRLDYKLYFNPNDTVDGIQGRISPHGLVMVLVCGTLHVDGVCVGVFEQVFGLARDPSSDNNWKVRKTELNLRSKNVLESPKLTDSDLTNKLLMLE